MVLLSQFEVMNEKLWQNEKLGANFQVSFSPREKRTQLLLKEGVLKNLALDSFFCHNLSFITSNFLKNHLDTYVSKKFQWYKECLILDNLCPLKFLVKHRGTYFQKESTV